MVGRALCNTSIGWSRAWLVVPLRAYAHIGMPIQCYFVFAGHPFVCPDENFACSWLIRRALVARQAVGTIHIAAETPQV
jgi:hypothetical protein